MTTCGDGIVAGNEECDDANNANSSMSFYKTNFTDDGCSSACLIESGFSCERS